MSYIEFKYPKKASSLKQSPKISKRHPQVRIKEIVNRYYRIQAICPPQEKAPPEKTLVNNQVSPKSKASTNSKIKSSADLIDYLSLYLAFKYQLTQVK